MTISAGKKANYSEVETVYNRTTGHVLFELRRYDKNFKLVENEIVICSNSDYNIVNKVFQDKKNTFGPFVPLVSEELYPELGSSPNLFIPEIARTPFFNFLCPKFYPAILNILASKIKQKPERISNHDYIG